MNDALRRSIRGFVQVSFVQAAIQLYNAFSEVDLTADQVQAITLFCTPIVALIQNLLEDNTSMPSLLKAPASEGKNPVPDDAGTVR